MINRFIIFMITAVLSGAVFSVQAQVDTVVGQVTSGFASSFAGGMTSNGRLIVFESNGNVATENPRNEDLNFEIFLFDYAQRRIFQITDTKSVLNDVTMPIFSSNIRVDISCVKPAISADGKWIAFGSNATTSVSGSPPDGTNPGSFDGNSFTDTMGDNPLTADANMELWLYQVPALASANLSSGDELPITDLSTGAFTQVTNTPAAIPPVAGSDTQAPSISSDNRTPSISDDGDLVAFVSNRNLVGTGNQTPEDNPEIFVYSRTGTATSQITETPRGPIFAPISSSVPTIAGNGSRVMFSSNGDNPIVGMTGGDNTDGNREVFFSDLTAGGAATGIKKQVSVTTPATPGVLVNNVGPGRRMSRDGNLIVFDSFADFTNEHSGENQIGFATFLYDATAATFRRLGSRSDADTLATGGDIEHFPVFTDYVGGVPQSVLMETRMNIAPDGEVPEDPEDGLNNTPNRAAQVYRYPINEPAMTAIFTRITTLPDPTFSLATIQIWPSDSSKRIAINLPGTETGNGNADLSPEVYYVLRPDIVREAPSGMAFSTGATKIPVQNDPLPTSEASSKAGKNPTGKSDGKPSFGPTPTPTATPTPTPSTPAAVVGLSPGMLAFLDYTAGLNVPVVARTGVGSIERRFELPIELSGISMTIGGAAVGLKRVSQRQIEFVVPEGLVFDLENPQPIVINSNGTVLRGEIVITEFRPDIFRKEPLVEANRARISNVTNRVHTMEPFTVTTLKYRGSRKVPTVLRVFATGIRGSLGTSTSIRLGQIPTGLTVNNAVKSAPGVYYIDFEMSSDMDMLGDQPVVMSILGSSSVGVSRLDADAPRISVL